MIGEDHSIKFGRLRRASHCIIPQNQRYILDPALLGISERRRRAIFFKADFLKFLYIFGNSYIFSETAPDSYILVLMYCQTKSKAMGHPNGPETVPVISAVKI